MELAVCEDTAQRTNISEGAGETEETRLQEQQEYMALLEQVNAAEEGKRLKEQVKFLFSLYCGKPKVGDPRSRGQAAF